ncbi:hypothetical protein AB0C10_15935 [Microbispora amethystogenes]|uniref:hypothetical protein n=1 Tax=Microbispora amethystogenes TaxID=1427754 RepID=UPI0033C1DC0A
MIQATPQPGHYIVWCDTGTCPYGISVLAADHDTAGTAAAGKGWTHANNTDHCPTCTHQQAPTTPSPSLKIPHNDAESPSTSPEAR